MSREQQHKLGPAGECICPKCRTRIPHQRGVRCQEESCPACGAKMLRVGSDDYQLWLKKNQDHPTG